MAPTCTGAGPGTSYERARAIKKNDPIFALLGFATLLAFLDGVRVLSYWELLYGTGTWPSKKFEAMQWPDHDYGDQKIETYSVYPLTFSKGNHFD
jgi:hypothetical protein